MSFKDWIGQDKHKQALQRDFVTPYQVKKSLQLLSKNKSSSVLVSQSTAKPANGMLLYGPPGCGKTHTAACLAGELGFELITLSKSTFGSPFVSQASINLENIFTTAFQRKNTVLFFDDADAVLGNRADNTASRASPNNETIAELLRWMDQCHHHNVIVILATNYLEQLDPALVRDGRIDLTLHLKPPNAGERASLLKHYFSATNLTDLDYQEIATVTEGFTPAELKTLVERSHREYLLNRAVAEANHQLVMEIVFALKKTKLKQWLRTQKLSEEEFRLLKDTIKSSWENWKSDPLSSLQTIMTQKIKAFNSQKQLPTA